MDGLFLLGCNFVFLLCLSLFVMFMFVFVVCCCVFVVVVVLAVVCVGVLCRSRVRKHLSRCCFWSSFLFVLVVYNNMLLLFVCFIFSCSCILHFRCCRFFVVISAVPVVSVMPFLLFLLFCFCHCLFG